MSNPPPLERGKFYHIYNRGNNRENLFREERNYRYFLQLYTRHIEPVAETFAYCLLPNHFHLLIRVRDPQPPQAAAPSRAFANWFNAYARTINQRYQRSGALFKRPFQRIAVTGAAYFARLVVYIHRNPQTHGLVSDFRDWAYSSYHSHLAAAPTRLQREAVLRWFHDAENFAAVHTQTLDETLLRNLIVELVDLTGGRDEVPNTKASERAHLSGLVDSLWRKLKKMETLPTLAQSEKDRIHITAIKVYQLKGHGIQSIIRVQTDAGIEGIGEAGLPAMIVQGYLDYMKESLIGQDALEIDKCYTNMIRMRAQWHAHWVQNPTISGIDMALWDIAGKVFNRPASRLLRGRFRDEIQLYVNTAGPANWFDPIACRDWAQEMHADPRGFKTIKFGFDYMTDEAGRKLHGNRYHGGQLSMMLKQTELKRIRQGYENCREALGWDMDIIVHCHNEWDLPTAIGIAEAVAPIKPLWVEDALPVMYSDAWKAFRQSSPVRVMTGEKLEHPAEFLQFMQNGAVDAIHPDLAFVGGLTGGYKIADLAEMYYTPVVTHNVGSYVQLIANAHYGASARNFVMSENRIPAGLLYEEMSEEGITVKDGNLKVPDGPGLGITLRPEVMNEIIENGRWE